MKFGTRVNLGCSKREAQEAVYSGKEGVIDTWNSRIAFNAFALFRVLYSSSFYLGDFVLVGNIWSGILRTWAKFMGHPAGFFHFYLDILWALFLFIFRGFGAQDHLLFFPYELWLVGDQALDDFHNLGHSAANCLLWLLGQASPCTFLGFCCWVYELVFVGPYR